MRLVSDNPEPESRLATVRVRFTDGTEIKASGVDNVDEDEFWLVIEQETGDYTKVRIDDNIQFVEVIYV